MVFPMRIDTPKYIYIINVEDVKPIGRRIRKDYPDSRIILMKTLRSFIEEEKEKKGTN